MKKVVLGIVALAMVASNMFFTSCDDKIITQDNKLDDHKKATIIIRTGIKKGTTEEYKPMSGESKMILKAENKSINWSNSASGMYEQVVDLNGDKIEVSVPVNEKEGTEYSVACVNFIADFTTADGAKSYVYKGGVTMVNGVALTNFKLMPGQVYTFQVRYSGTEEAKVK
jgi:lipoprotein